MGGRRPVSDRRRSVGRYRHRPTARGKLTNDDLARAVQLGIEYDPHPPHGAIDWSHVDRDSLAARVKGNAEEALAEQPAMLARLLG